MVLYSENFPEGWREEIVVTDELKLLVVFADAMPARGHLAVRLVAPRARAEVTALCLGRNADAASFEVELIHAAPETYGRVAARAALFDESRFSLRGVIKVLPEARGSDSYLSSRALLVSDRARAEFHPHLEIRNHEVRASHGSSVGRLDEEALFYLRSRGIPRLCAEPVLLAGFFRDGAARLPGAYREKFFQTPSAA